MANQYDKGMDDYYSGSGIPKNPTIEYFQGYEYAESMSRRDDVYPEPPTYKEYEMVELTCMGCGQIFMGYEPQRCCSGIDCTCRGMPIDPVICSKECYDKLPFRVEQIQRDAAKLLTDLKQSDHDK